MRVICPKCQWQYELVPTEKVNRTNLQNRYYWGQVVAIPARESGYLDDEMHSAFKMMFLKKSEDRTKPPTVKSTATLTTQEFSEYVEKCRQWCAENGYDVPNPGDPND